MKNKKKSFGAEISADLADTFTEYVDEAGFQKFRSIEAALRLFVRAPIELQVACMFDNSTNRKDLEVDKQIKTYKSELQNLIKKGLPLSLADKALKSQKPSRGSRKKD